MKKTRLRLEAIAKYEPFRDRFGGKTCYIFDNLDAETFVEIARRCGVSRSRILAIMKDLERMASHPSFRHI